MFNHARIPPSLASVQAAAIPTKAEIRRHVNGVIPDAARNPTFGRPLAYAENQSEIPRCARNDKEPNVGDSLAWVERVQDLGVRLVHSQEGMAGIAILRDFTSLL